jgi:aryl-alcohol dehydrogenase-like predicted oxidoreductase
MELRSLGTSEVKITPIIMGTWQAGKEMWEMVILSESSVKRSLMFGIR